jgi:hypothetical protein
MLHGRYLDLGKLLVGKAAGAVDRKLRLPVALQLGPYRARGNFSVIRKHRSAA